MTCPWCELPAPLDAEDVIVLQGIAWHEGCLAEADENATA